MELIIKKLDKFETYLIVLLFTLFFFLGVNNLFGARIKEITSIVGVRENQLIGYGLIVGLQGTGDGTTSKFTAQALANLLKTANLNINQNDIKSKNIAAVMVTAKLPPFGRQGDKIDVLISSIGDAKSLEGGTLLMTPLKGLDGKIYAIAQGAITVGGFNSAGGIGQKNHTTVAKLIGGATIEREVSYDLYSKQYATLSLKKSSFEDAIRIQDVINSFYEIKVAVALDPRTIKLKKPKDMSMVEFLANIEQLEVKTQKVNKIVIQEKTGTVIAGVDVTVKPINIMHGSFAISIDKSLIKKSGRDKITVSDVTSALQKLGASSRDIISILEALKEAGALDAKLEVI